MDEFNISAQMTKKTLIEEHERLLDAYRAKIAETEAADQRAASAASRLQSLAVAREATVDGVIENLGQTRAQVGRTLNELTERMTAQADRLEALNRAIADREKRLEELGDIETATTTLATLVAAYDERRQAVEDEFALRIQEVEENYVNRTEELEEQSKSRAADLELQHEQASQKLGTEISERRQQWKTEQTRAEAENTQGLERSQREKSREEEEYVYQRDRDRQLELDQHEDEKARRDREMVVALEKQQQELDALGAAHKTKLEAAKAEQEARLSTQERSTTEREANLVTREKELDELHRRLEETPARIDDATAAAAKEARAEARTDIAHEQKVLALEHEWATKVSKERISHLEREIKERDGKLKELKADLDTAWRQVNQLAEKALERSNFSPSPPPQTTPVHPPKPQEG
jgi:hypothetical protein